MAPRGGSVSVKDGGYVYMVGVCNSKMNQDINFAT